MKDLSTNSYPLLERRKLQELQRTLMMGEELVTFGWPDNASGVVPRQGADASSSSRTMPLFATARTKLVSCAVTVALATSAATAADDQTHGLPFPNEAGHIQHFPAPVAVVESAAEPAAAEFKWNRSIYRARKKAKEYGS